METSSNRRGRCRTARSVVDLDGALGTFIEFKESQKEFEFSDDLASESLVGQFLKISVKLVNVDGDES